MRWCMCLARLGLITIEWILLVISRHTLLKLLMKDSLVRVRIVEQQHKTMELNDVCCQLFKKLI